MLDGFLPLLLKGCAVTIALAVCALLLGLCFGLLGAWGESSSRRIVRVPILLLTTVLRGLPELLIILSVYFGGTLLMTKLMGHYTEVGTFTAGVFALALIFGAYATQVIRGAFASIPSGQRESAMALGMRRKTLFRQILLPQAIRFALPGLGNLWLVLLKDTALVSLIGLADLMSNAGVAATQTRQPFTFFLTAALVYLLFTAATGHLLKRLEARSFAW